MTGFVVACESTSRATNFVTYIAREITLDVVLHGAVVRKMSPFVTD